MPIVYFHNIAKQFCTEILNNLYNILFINKTPNRAHLLKYTIYILQKKEGIKKYFYEKSKKSSYHELNLTN